MPFPLFLIQRSQCLPGESSYWSHHSLSCPSPMKLAQTQERLGPLGRERPEPTTSAYKGVFIRLRGGDLGWKCHREGRDRGEPGWKVEEKQG